MLLASTLVRLTLISGLVSTGESFHLLVETPKTNLSIGTRRLNSLQRVFS